VLLKEYSKEAGSCAVEGIRRPGPVFRRSKEAGSCASKEVRGQSPVLLKG